MNAYLTKQEAAERMGVTPAQLHHWTFDPQQRRADVPLPVLVCEGRGRSKARWLSAEVDAWRARNV